MPIYMSVSIFPPCDNVLPARVCCAEMKGPSYLPDVKNGDIPSSFGNLVPPQDNSNNR